MKILLTADTHGLLPAIERFARMLREGDYDCGIIAGDILDDGFKPEALQEAIEETDLEADDFLTELPGAEETFGEYADRQLQTLHDPESPLVRTLAHIERKFKEVLRSAGKPVYVVAGNHDLTPWEDDGNVINVHDRRIDLGPLNLVGYRWTSLDRMPEDHERDIRRLRKLVGRRTVLVTHTPPRGVLDTETRDNGMVFPYGSEPIRRMVARKKPRLHLFGHVHGSFGRDGRSINASFPNSRQFVAVDTDSRVVRFVESGVHDPIG